PGLWYPPMSGWKGSGFAFLLMAATLLVLAIGARTWSIHAVLVPVIGLNLQYALGGNARFWLPVTVLLSVALAVRASSWLARFDTRITSTAVGCVALIWFASLVGYVAMHERAPYG